MKEHRISFRPFRRREALAQYGAAAATLVLGGCTFLKGGASHPAFPVSPGQLQGSTLRLPIKQMQFPADGVLLVEPGDGHPKLLVRRDPDGKYIVATAKCTHWGCTVGWDPTRHCWACPCHGSAFATDGKVIEGPASDPLPIPSSHLEGDTLVIELPVG